MLYLTLDDESLDTNEPILFKSEKIERLTFVIEDYKNYEWTISNMPINWNEEDYKLVN